MKRIILLLVLLNTNLFLAQTIIYVNASASGGNTGTNWANAYTSFQSALTRARSNANSGSPYQIWVAKGTYRPSSSYDLSPDVSYRKHFRMINYTAIYGGFNGSETSISQRVNYGLGELNETILSGDINGDDNYSVTPWTGTSENCDNLFYHPSGLNSAALLDGFTLKGGNSHYYNANGGAMFNNSSSPTLQNLIIINNRANGEGGGIYNYNYSSPTLKNVIIRNNLSYNLGGGICNSNSSSPTIINSVICNNQGTGGGMFIKGSASPLLINVIICNNQGEGIYCSSGSATLNNCIIWGNTLAQSRQFTVYSGAITLNYSCYSNGNGDVFTSSSSFSPSNCITTNPLFVNAAGYDFRITGLSPCADAGNDSYNSETYDVRGVGFARKLNKTTGETGTIDMGAYEYKVSQDPLPVELTGFSANIKNDKVTLTWQTATEVNNYGFEVQRSLAADHTAQWEAVGFVNGAGNSNSPKVYSFTDLNLNARIKTQSENEGMLVRYRLKQIDNDGTYSYSSEVEVNINSAPAAYNLSCYPNPFNPETTIKYAVPEASGVNISVFSMLGEKVATLFSGELEAGSYEQKFSGNNLAGGIYIITLSAGKNVSIVKKALLMK